jgi:hypothetical protein
MGEESDPLRYLPLALLYGHEMQRRSLRAKPLQRSDAGLRNVHDE